MVDFTSDDIAQRSFRTTLRGFDPSEVREFLSELAETVAALASERDRLATTLQASDAADLKQEIEQVSSEIHSVLEAARGAAETMRERASTESARWRSEAIAAAETTRREAEADAEHLRTDAWTTSEALLTQVQREVERIRSEAEKESLRLVGESEREAHRTLGTGRREAEETLRTARMEAEKLVMDARASHNEIIETATRKAEIAQERTRALEERRDELRRELDSVRAAITSVESELDERREALSLTPSPEETAPDNEDEWVPGETVRVVRPGQPEGPTDELPVISEPRPRPDPTPELRVLTPEELRTRQQRASTPDPVREDEEEVDVLADFGEDEPLGSVGAEVEEVPDSQPAEPEGEVPDGADDVGESAGEDIPAVDPSPSAFDDVEGLFARLRDPVDETPSSQDGPVPVAGEPSAATRRQASPTLDLDPFEVRDGFLLPITNRALRNLKRQLTTEQNNALEAIRIDEAGWEPDSDALTVNVRPDLVVLAAESFAAGHAAAEALTSSKLTRPATPTEAISVRFVSALVSDLERAVTDGRAHEHGARQLASDISRVFRAWRTDESERRIRQFSYEAFHHGMLASLPDDGTYSLRWLVAGRGCAVCRDFGGREPVEDPPPAHDGCACTVIPISR